MHIKILHKAAIEILNTPLSLTPLSLSLSLEFITAIVLNAKFTFTEGFGRTYAHYCIFFCVYRIRMYEHEGQWEKAVITYDIRLQQHSTDREVDLLKVCGQAT